MAIIRLFAGAKDAAGTGRDEIPGSTVAEVIDGAVQRYGDRFAAVLGNSKIWVNGQPADEQANVSDSDELAVLPPVSGGCR